MRKILIWGLTAFAFVALWQSIHRFHSEKLRAVEPGGVVLWRGGPLPSKEPETVAFTRAFARAGRQEIRLYAWSLTGGSLWLDGNRLGDLPVDRAGFFRVPGDRLKDPMTFRIEAPSKDGWGAVWMAEMTGFGTDGSWICSVNGASCPLRIWGTPPLSSFPALSRQ